MAICERCEGAISFRPGHAIIKANEYGEFVCDDCEQNAAERAYDRHQESLMSGDTPTFRETYLAAYEQKRGLK